MRITGTAFVFGNDVNTDEIIPARCLVTTDPKELALHCMEDARPGFASIVRPGSILVAGRNFGCGSSREHAPIALKAAGISCVVAESFARIFFRNAINIGLPIVPVQGIAGLVGEGEKITVDLGEGMVLLASGQKLSLAPFPPFMEAIVREGGWMPYLLASYGKSGKLMSGRRTIIYDTTLRDGMQGQGINYTLEDKIQIAVAMDEIGIDYIEGGFPLSNRKESEFFQRMRKANLRHARIVAFGSTRRPQAKAASDPQITALLRAETPTVIVVGKTWKAHVREVLQTTEAENLHMIADSLATLKAAGREVFYDLEHFFDGYKDDPAYALSALRAAREAGADCLVLCDTNGGTLPSEVSRILSELPLAELGHIGVHFHDDTGNAIANTLAALDRGAVHVQGTINGWGERCGNMNLCTLIPTLCLKLGDTAQACAHLKQLTPLSRFVAEKANIIPDKRQPYVGEAAFSHKAGQHADVISKAPRLMEHIDGALVGNERRVLLSELAGKSTIVKKLARYGDFEKSADVVSRLLVELKTLEEKGYEYEAAEASFDLVMRRALGQYKSLLELGNYHLENYKSGDTPAKTVGRLFVRVSGNLLMGAAVGDGPVDTLNGALRDALLPLHPFLSKLKLTDYRVRVLDPERATAARVRVFITTSDGEQTWDTVGVDENIIEASWQALVDGLEYYYNNFVLNGGT